MTTNKLADVIVVIKKNGIAKLIVLSPEHEMFFDGEFFTSQLSEPEWLGFYDWLRTINGDVIGVRLQLDEGEIDGETLRFLISLDGRNSVDSIYIFFGTDREFDPARSDDADFGGNILLRGNMGSLAITFNAPS